MKDLLKAAIAISNVGTTIIQQHQHGDAVDSFHDSIAILEYITRRNCSTDPDESNMSVQALLDRSVRRLAAGTNTMFMNKKCESPYFNMKIFNTYDWASVKFLNTLFQAKSVNMIYIDTIAVTEMFNSSNSIQRLAQSCIPIVINNLSQALKCVEVTRSYKGSELSKEFKLLQTSIFYQSRIMEHNSNNIKYNQKMDTMQAYDLQVMAIILSNSIKSLSNISNPTERGMKLLYSYQVKLLDLKRTIHMISNAFCVTNVVTAAAA
jgi:hypothetical protein